MIVAKYKFNPSTYADLLPIFNNGGTFNYTKSDVTNGDGSITRTINSDSLPTVMKFGDSSATTRASSLLEILDMNASNLTTMDSMFRYCDNLTNISCSWDTSKVKTMNYAFASCTSLTSLDLSTWDTREVTSVNNMFRECTSLTSVDLIGWDNINLTDMSAMFYNCSSLISVNLNRFNTSKVTNMTYMFMGCSSLTSIVIDSWDTSQVTTMMSMFYLCSSLTSLDLSNWNTSRLTNTSYMFNGCNKLTSLDLSNWNTCRLTSMNYMFNECSSLTSLDLSNWNTCRLTNMNHMFSKCSSLTSLDISNWDTSRLTSMGSMFDGCSSLTSLDLSNWNTSKVVDMGYVFSNCTSLTTLDLSNWHISESTSTSGFFVGSMPNFYKVNLKYADEYTVSKVVIEFPNRINTTPGYVLSSVDFTSTKNWQRIKSSHNNFYLPQPLRKVGDVKDRLYWDENKGHYCIEQNFTKKVFDGSDDEDWREHYLPGNEDKSRYCYYPLNVSVYPEFATTDNVVLCDKLTWRHAHNWGTKGVPIEDEFLININQFCVFKSSISTVSEFKEWISQNPITLIHPLETPNIIDLPYLNQKLTFDSYNSSTTIDIPNRPLKASKTYLDAPIARYRYTNLQPSTQYNVQFDCKGDAAIKVNLGGTEVTFTPTSDWTRKNLTITTPSELVNDKLSISNVGITSNNKVDNVMLFSEVITQEPDYIDDIQSIGELQDDGTYKIDILTTNDISNLYTGDVTMELGAWTEGGFSVASSVEIRCKNPFTPIPQGVKNGDVLFLILSDTTINSNTNLHQYDSNKEYTAGQGAQVSYFANGVATITIKDISKIQYFSFRAVSSNTKCKWGLYLENNGFIERIVSKQSILLPQPLNKIGDIKDKFYWDDDKCHYCIKQNVGSIHIDIDMIGEHVYKGDAITTLQGQILLPKIYKQYSKGFTTSSLQVIPYLTYGTLSGNTCMLRDDYMFVFIQESELSSMDEEGIRQWFRDNDTTVYFELSTPQIIDLPEMNKKLTFDTYLPNTYVDVTNLPLQPYKLQLEDDTVRYKSTIEPNTLYTIQFNCLSKLTTNLTLDLGGTRKTVDPIIGVNHVQITTPSELASDRLFLIGTGIVVKEVIVNKGNMNQYPKYFDGEQSVGELQTDGTYKIVIKTNEGFTVTIRTSSPLTKLDKIYWNNIEKRYEIDRNGVIEVPTVEGDIINLPRLYQKVDTTISISTDNIEPSKIDISYKDIH